MDSETKKFIDDLQEQGIPVLDMSAPNFEKQFEFAIMTTGSSSDYRNDRERPYNGQPHTDQGERGKQLVSGLTMRDIMDCFVKAWLYCLAADNPGLYDRVKRGEWRYGDVYKYDAPSIDPLAVGQNITCEIEKMMGIFPNVSPLNLGDS